MSIPDAFWNTLKHVYLNALRDDTAWQEEHNAIRGILPLVLEELSGRYALVEPIDLGGASIVLKLDDSNLDTPVALKLARPIRGRESDLNEVIASEISRLRESSHPNIVAILWQGQVEWDKQIWPYYLMEYFDGAVNALVFLQRTRPEARELVDILRQAVAGLQYLHGQNVIHGDVKLENILVAPDRSVKLSDLGSARVLDKGPEMTVITFTVPYAHPSLVTVVHEAKETTSDRNRQRARIRRSDLRKIFDVYALGKNIRRMINEYDLSETTLLPIYERAYLDLMACRMLDGFNQDDECALGLPRHVFEEVKYREACRDDAIEQVARDIRKLTGERAIHNVIQELDHHYASTIQVSSAGSPPLTPRLVEMLKRQVVRRLGNISQLGLACRVYPTARHSRLEHTLGTFSNACQFVDALWNDPVNPLFRQVVSEQDVQAVLLAALCHDIGYYPLAHDFHEAEAKADLFSHHALTSSILTGDLAIRDSEQLLATIRDRWDVSPERVAQILDASPADLTQPFVDRLLHTVIDGPIDADKLDYLVRDSVNLSVSYGHGIDKERLLKCLTVAFRREGQRTFVAVGIHEKGKVPAESVAFARYALFGAVYWHHTVRAMKAMLYRAVWEAIPTLNTRRIEYKQFRQDFLDVAFRPRAPIQPKLWYEGGAAMLQAADLPPGDLRMIEWLYERTSAQGRSLLAMLCDRKLFKRLHVLSSDRAAVWPDLVAFAEKYGYEQLIEFQNEVQEQLVEILSASRGKEDDAGRPISALVPEVIDVVEAMHSQGQVLLLVDIPKERPGAKIDLCYLPEHRLGAPFVAASEKAGRLEFSKVWGTLSDALLASVGKVRVFCHPEISDAAEAGLPRDEVERVLEAALRLVKSR